MVADSAPVALALREQLLPPNEQVPTTEDDWKIDHLVVAG